MFTSESLKQYRQSLRLSRRAFADITGYTESYIYMLETNRKPITVQASKNIKKSIETYYEESKKIIEGGIIE